MANYSKYVKSVPAPQTVKSRVDQVKNNAGGYVYNVGDWSQLDRFLILGTEKGTYYAGEKKLTLDNVKCVKNLLAGGFANGKKVIDRVVEISSDRRAIKEDPALFVMALALSDGDKETRSYAAAKLPEVARTGTHLFTFVDFANDMRKWGRTMRKACANWYNSKEPSQLAYQVTKYQSRTKEGSQTWSQKDILRKAHVKPATAMHSAILKWVVGGWEGEVTQPNDSFDSPFNVIYAHEAAKRAVSADRIVQLIEQYGLVRESIPSQFLKENKVWLALLKDMPVQAMVRNLGSMTSRGVLGLFADGNKFVTDKLRNPIAIKKSGVHPIFLLNAMKQYASGKGGKSDATWTPVQSILDALNDAFYLSFKNVEPSGKNILVALDCSGSMQSNMCVGMPLVNSMEAGASLALAVATSEPNYHIIGFSAAGGRVGYATSRYADNAVDGMGPLPISPGMRLDSAVRDCNQKWTGGATDCSLPMLYAIKHNLKVDAFVIITDNETYAGKYHVDEALRMYRKHSGRNAKLVVCATTATPFAIGDPNDAGVLDIQGFDTAAPQLISNFVADKF